MESPNVVTTRIEIINTKGLHARAAAALRRVSSDFSAQIMILHEGREAEANSIMSLLMLMASKGSVIEIRAIGEDAANAVEAIADLTRNRFGEDA